MCEEAKSLALPLRCLHVCRILASIRVINEAQFATPRSGMHTPIRLALAVLIFILLCSISAAQETDRAAAEAAYQKGEQLRKQATPESRRQSLKPYEEALRLWQSLSDTDGERKTLNALGQVNDLLGEREKELEYFRKALPLHQAAGDQRSLAFALYGLGQTNSALGDHREAVNYYKQALEIRHAAGERFQEGLILNNLGVQYWFLGQIQDALDAYAQALDIRTALQDRLGVAYTLNGIGVAYYSSGRPQKALETYLRMLPLWRDLKDRRGEANALNNVGLLYASLGDAEKALTNYEEALFVWREIKDRAGEAYTVNNIGLLHSTQGEYQKALANFNSALPALRALGDRRGEAYALQNIGDVHEGLGEHEKARQFYDESLHLKRRLEDRYGEAYTLQRIGESFRRAGDVSQASKNFDQALKLHREVGDRNGEAAALAGMAWVERDQRHWNAARERIEESLRLTDAARIQLDSQNLRATFLASRLEDYGFYIDLLMQLHEEQAAFEAAERARARALLDALTKARPEIRQGVAPGLLQKEESLQQEINAQAERLSRLQSSRSTAKVVAEARAKLDELIISLGEIQAGIRKKSPHYAALMQPEPSSLKEIQQSILDKDTLLLEYWLGQEHSFLWVITPTEMSTHELPPRAVIESAARRVYRDLTARNDTAPNETLQQKHGRTDRADDAFRTDASALSDLLLAPGGPRLKKRLLVVSDGALHYIPFAALPAPRRVGETSPAVPLALTHEIVNLPSASVAVQLEREEEGGTNSPPSLFVAADPVFQSNDPRVKIERVLTKAGFTRLHFSREEAEQILALVPRNRTRKAVDFDASRATLLKTDLTPYRILHFATHTILDSTHPELSGIVLSMVDQSGQPQEGFLRLFEIYNLKLRADLVVLSSCETALGREIGGEGLLGLTRGFLYAGAERVLASLWSVPDRATSEYMRLFYLNMIQKGKTPAAAMRAAQLALQKNPQWKAPYYWAGFTLQGKWK